jgi:putative iron-dependent peroxidase
MTANAQPGILAPLPSAARYLTAHLRPDRDPRDALRALAKRAGGGDMVVGLGASLVARLEAKVPGLRPHPHHALGGIEVPSTPASLWVWLRGDDKGELLHAGRAVRAILDDAFEVESAVDGFSFREGRDLTGYVDGTENPEGEAAEAAAFVAAGPLAGSSFVAVQRWHHDLAHFESLPPEERDHIIGRRQSDNEELEDAPASAHVKRTAQESFEPEAFVLRRSMPWANGQQHGLVFIAFGKSFDAYEAQLRRMVGLDDGITDGVFRFSAAHTGAFFWCPPVRSGELDLTAVGLA